MLHRLNRRPLHALLVLAMLSTPSCSPGSTGTAPTDMKFDTTAAIIKGKGFTLEIADTEEKISRGLMFRQSMPADHGMIFVFDKPQPNISFWMKNTLIPLDIVFLDAKGKVLEIHDRKPLDETGRGPTSPAQYVIELNAGTSATIGLKPGDTVEIPAKVLKPAATQPEK